MRKSGSGRRVESRSSDTAEINAAQRASETRRRPEERIIEDPYARYFVKRPAYRLLAASRPPGWAAMRFLDRLMPGLNAIILLRARYSAEVVAEAVGEGVDQVVLLGAGYDSTAMRIPVTVYEVDSPPTQRAKLERMEKHGLAAQSRAVYVPCDFERESPGRKLVESGFDSTRRCVVVWFRVSFYLTTDAVAAALRDMAAITTGGSTLLLDYMDPSIADGTTTHAGARRLARSVERRGESYRSGFTDEDIERVLGGPGFQVREQVHMADLGHRYGGPEGVWCRTDDLFRIVRAERRGSA